MVDSINLRRIRFGFFASCPAGQGEKINVQPEPRGVQLNFCGGFFPLKMQLFSLKVELKRFPETMEWICFLRIAWTPGAHLQ